MKKIFFLMLIPIFISSCGIADLRTAEIKKDQQSETDQQKAERLLASAIKKQGLDKVSQFETYEVIGNDDWKGLLGSVGNVWDWKDEKVAMRFAVGDFDGQIEVLEGKKKGFTAGIQSWDYYEIEKGKYNTDVKTDKRIQFALAAYHYFYELGTRLARAPKVWYVGEGEIEGVEMDKILVSWGNNKTKAYDQYVLWISKESGIIEATTHTVRDNYLPMAGFLYSTTRFTNFKDVDGVLIPFRQTVQLKNPKDKVSKYIHQFSVESFTWDAFPLDKIRPNSNLDPIGDDKVSLSWNDMLRIDDALSSITLMD